MRVIITVIAFSVSTVVFAFTTFSTKEEIKQTVIERLDRIEMKLDRVLENR